MSLLNHDSAGYSLCGSRNYFSVIYLFQNLFADPHPAGGVFSAFLKEEVSGWLNLQISFSFIWSYMRRRR